MCWNGMTDQFSQRPDRPIFVPNMIAQQVWAHDGVPEQKRVTSLTPPSIIAMAD